MEITRKSYIQRAALSYVGEYLKTHRTIRAIDAVALVRLKANDPTLKRSEVLKPLRRKFEFKTSNNQLVIVANSPS